MIAGLTRETLVGAIALAGILGASAAGTLALTSPGASSLAVFEREATEVEIEKEEQLAASGYLAGSEITARLLLETPPRGERESGQRVWAISTPGSETSFFGVEDLVCLMVETTPGTAGAAQGCMTPDVIARRGFVPIDAPRPYLFDDGEEFVIEWGPTGDARLIDRPTPPSP